MSLTSYRAAPSRDSILPVFRVWNWAIVLALGDIDRVGPIVCPSIVLMWGVLSWSRDTV